MSSAEKSEAGSKSAPESSATMSGLQQVENAFDLEGNDSSARSLLTQQFNDLMAKGPDGTTAAANEWLQLGNDDSARHDNVLPFIALDWGMGQTMTNDTLTQSDLSKAIANPEGDSPGEKMLNQLSAQYILDNYGNIAGLTFDAPGQDEGDEYSLPGVEISQIPIIAQDIETAQSAMDKPPGWNAPQPEDPQESLGWKIVNYLFG